MLKISVWGGGARARRWGVQGGSHSPRVLRIFSMTSSWWGELMAETTLMGSPQPGQSSERDEVALFFLDDHDIFRCLRRLLLFLYPAEFAPYRR